MELGLEAEARSLIDRVCKVLVLGGGASQVALVVKALPANAGDLRASGSIPGSGRSSAGENGYPLQHSCLENPRDRGAWWAIVHGMPKVLEFQLQHQSFQ